MCIFYQFLKCLNQMVIPINIGMREGLHFQIFFCAPALPENAAVWSCSLSISEVFWPALRRASPGLPQCSSGVFLS